MSTLDFKQFSGEVPRLLPSALPDAGSQFSQNIRLDDGALSPIRKKRFVYSFSGVSGAIKTIFRHKGTWLAWNSVVDAVPGPVADDRLYYTGDGVPKVRLESGTIYDLKIAFPSSAPVATASGTGGGNVVTRIYVYTYVTSLGEESEPSKASNEVSWQTGKTVTLSNMLAPAAGRGIVSQRIYRSQSGQTVGTDFFLIAERPVSSANYVDNVAVDAIAEAIPSKTYTSPPDNMAGLTSLPNGMMAAFAGKELLFCEPFRPHAWPEKYRLTMDYEIVGLGAFGNSILVMTTGNPYVVSGTSPDTMISERMEMNLPCINARGIVDMGYSIAYPSTDGLVSMGSAGPKMESLSLMTRTDWAKAYPQTFVAAQYSGRYFASYSAIVNSALVEGTIIFDLASQTPFIVRTSDRADAFFYDIQSCALYLLQGTSVYEYDPFGMENEVAVWHSKQATFPYPATFGCILIESSESLTADELAADEAAREAIIAANNALFATGSLGGAISAKPISALAINGNMLQTIPPSLYCVVEVYGDGDLVDAVSVVGESVRLPAHRKCKVWEVKANFTLPLKRITLATSPRELNDV